MTSSPLSTASSALIIFILLLLHQLQPIHAAVVPAVIVFGDSIVDTGNNNGLVTAVKCNFPPYGRDFIRHEPTGRFSNGKITSDFIASGLRVKELLPSYYAAVNKDLPTGVSFASGGTGYDDLTALKSLVPPMSTQLEHFKEYKKRLETIVGKKQATSIISKSLIVVCSGSNDVDAYFDGIIRKVQYDIPAYADFLTASASNFTQELLDLGVTKFAVLGIPPIGCVPKVRASFGGKSRDCGADHNKLAQLYNSKLSRELQRLTSNNNGTKLIYVNIYDTLLDLMQNPEKNGFEESTRGCCGTNEEVGILCNRFSATCKNASSYVFWDSFHPTEAADKILVERLLKKYIRYIE